MFPLAHVAGIFQILSLLLLEEPGIGFIGPALQVVTMLVSAGIFLATVRKELGSLKDGQRSMALALKSVAESVHALVTKGEVSKVQFEEAIRRIDALEKKVTEIDRLRTKVHLISSKIMEIDPKWAPYRPDREAL